MPQEIISNEKNPSPAFLYLVLLKFMLLLMVPAVRFWGVGGEFVQRSANTKQKSPNHGTIFVRHLFLCCLGFCWVLLKAGLAIAILKQQEMESVREIQNCNENSPARNCLNWIQQNHALQDSYKLPVAPKTLESSRSSSQKVILGWPKPMFLHVFHVLRCSLRPKLSASVRLKSLIRRRDVSS